MRALVVGHGSIGRRHSRILAELGCEVGIVSRQHLEHPALYRTLGDALDCFAPDYVVVANRTSEHHEAIGVLADAGFEGRVLVEKPMFDRLRECPSHRFAAAAVAYNLRFHPLLRELKSLLDGEEQVLTANIYVGMYLPDWRPDSDYRVGYSASRELGGGCLRDLSHELDYTAWLLGPWRRLTATGGHLSDLVIDTDDAFSVMGATVRCPLVTVHMNYLDRVARRTVVINTSSRTLFLDLTRGVLLVNDASRTVTVDRDETYRDQHRAMLAGTSDVVCSFDEALAVIRTIDLAERAAADSVWVNA